MSDATRAKPGNSMAEVIRFYGTRDAYGEFSNFFAAPFELNGKRWPTSEHYFQAQKFAGTEHEEAIRRVASPTIAARMGRNRKQPLRPDWEVAKDDIMREAVRAKFRQHPKLWRLLLSTGDATLVEHTAKDSYWGDGGDGSGRNMLGRILMEVREELRTEGDIEGGSGRTCPDCDGPMSEIRLVDRTHHGAHADLEYAVIESLRSRWTGQYPIDGRVAAFLCMGCGRIILYGAPKRAE